MKVLWFSSTPSLYAESASGYNGRGWIESLQLLLQETDGTELAVAFFHPVDKDKVCKGSTTYYPIHRPAGRKRPIRQMINNWCGRLGDADYSKQYLDVINDFQPDVIHVFGTESGVSTVQSLTDKPVVIHLQGLINPCLNAYFPAGCSGLEFFANRDYLLKTLKGSSPWHGRRLFARQAARERNILRNTRYVMGRTHWDAMVARLYNPSVSYYHVDEVLRPVFYQRNEKAVSDEQTFRIVSTLSPTIYKGLDVVLRTARQLQELTDIRFTWQIAGLDADDPLMRHFEKEEGIDRRAIGVQCIGKQSPEQLVKLLSKADVFVHPSYIDNSPNSVCEAQMLGLPVIACDVGGLSTLITHQQSGILVPSNGVFELVHYLRELANNPQQRMLLGKNAKAIAQQRHDKPVIVQRLIAAYNEIAGNP